MRVCADCLSPKPPECFLGSECVACTGRRAGQTTDRARWYRRIEAHKAREAGKSALQRYWENREPQYIPDEWVRDWIKDVRSMVPKLIDSL